MMNAISRALAKRDRQRMEVRREAGAESGTDWATEKQRQWQELGRKRVLASRAPYKHCEGLDRDIQEARRRGLSYGYYMAKKVGILL